MLIRFKQPYANICTKSHSNGKQLIQKMTGVHFCFTATLPGNISQVRSETNKKRHEVRFGSLDMKEKLICLTQDDLIDCDMQILQDG